MASLFCRAGPFSWAASRGSCSELFPPHAPPGPAVLPSSHHWKTNGQTGVQTQDGLKSKMRDTQMDTEYFFSAFVYILLYLGDVRLISWLSKLNSNVAIVKEMIVWIKYFIKRKCIQKRMNCHRERTSWFMTPRSLLLLLAAWRPSLQLNHVSLSARLWAQVLLRIHTHT